MSDQRPDRPRMEYIIVGNIESRDMLEETVNEMIKAGWRPQGGLAMSMTLGPDEEFACEYAQAMVRETGGSKS